MHHLQSESPVCADLPRSVCAVQQDSGLLHGSERLRWEGMGMSGLFTTRRPGCTPCSASSLERGDFCDTLAGSSEGVTHSGQWERLSAGCYSLCSCKTAGWRGGKGSRVVEAWPPQREQKSGAHMSLGMGWGMLGRPQGQGHPL